MSEALGQFDDMWTPYKELQNFVEGVLSNPQSDSITQLENHLKNHKQNFITLLKNPPKNAKNREELKKGISDGITIPGIGHQTLSKELVDETIIISDMYDLNENAALDLLCTAQQQMPYHPGLTRGIVAILLYYDGRKALITTLRTLVQARKGISWTVEIDEQLCEFITHYTDQLLEYGLIPKILELLERLDLSKELDLLRQNRALGGPRHQRQVLDLFQAIRQSLADIVFLWSAQSSLPRDDTLALVSHLRRLEPSQDHAGVIDPVTLALQMALLYSLDVSFLNRTEDIEGAAQMLPLLKDPELAKSLLRELTSNTPWASTGLQALSQFTWGITLASLRMSPQGIQPIPILDEDDTLVDAAIELKLFEFLQHSFFPSTYIFKEEFYLKRLHQLMSDFLILMPIKIKELRQRADETSRTMQMYAQEGLEPPVGLTHHFEQLLLALATLYSKDPLGLELALDFWSAEEFSAPQSLPGPRRRLNPRQVALYKFVRIAGDLLPPALFVPYLRMLTSLASTPRAAPHAFALLKGNALAGGANLTWDHFFTSLNRYYTNLRQEAPPSADTVYRQRSHPRGITPQEMLGLRAVLTVMRAISDNDKVARLALAKNPSWAAIPVLLGLVSCAVPIPLKAELMLTLASLAKASDTAAALWHQLESSQILATVPSASSYQPRGVQTELEEIEARNEEFPLTRALLKLLDILTEGPVPKLLGAGTRDPGFEPYLRFIVDSVLLRFNTRSYKNPEERWEVAEGCLGLLVKFLDKYEPSSDDFTNCSIEIQGGGTARLSPPPGFHLMVNLNAKSELLRLILWILDESCRLLDTYTPFPGKENLETTTLYCLRILERALRLQDRFHKLLTSSGSSLLLTSLPKLLLGVNPRTGRPDHLLHVAKHVSYGAWLPLHALTAVRVLTLVTKGAQAQTQLLAEVTASKTTIDEVRRAFVDCLESDEGLEDLQEAVLYLLHRSLPQPSPNLAHFLLGFDINRDFRTFVFQQPGVLGFPRTCLHSIISILDTALAVRLNKHSRCASNSVIISGYALLYNLACESATSSPTLRFLRSCADFLCRHVAALPFIQGDKTSEYNQMAWLLKTVAIELKTSTGDKRVSHLIHLMRLLFKEKTPDELSETSGLGYKEILCDALTNEEPYNERMLHNLLGAIELCHETPPLGNWPHLPRGLAEKALIECEKAVPIGEPKLIDVNRLHKYLVNELASRQPHSGDIQELCKYALRLNEHRTLVAASVCCLQAWNHVTEILLLVAPSELFSQKSIQKFLIDCLHLIFLKIKHKQLLPEVANLTSSVILVLLVNLRKCLKIQMRDSGAEVHVDTKITTYTLILSSLIEWMLSSGVSSQRLRVNQYGAFLHLLTVTVRDNASKTWYQGSLEVISTFGENLVDCVSRDCIGGHDVSKMLALACLDVLVELDPHSNYIAYLSSRGYLKHVSDSLLDCDAKLIAMLEPGAVSLRALYVYESKMALLCRVASTRLGAELLLQQGVFTNLGNMLAFDKHPDVHYKNPLIDSDFVPPPAVRYTQILLPALNLCDAVLTTLGTENLSCCAQVLDFLLAHNSMVTQILRVGHLPGLNITSMRELARLTGVIARASYHEKRLSSGQSHLGQIRIQMLSLLSRFLLNETTLKELQQPSIERSPEGDDQELVLLFLQVACNLALFARYQQASNEVDHRIREIVFRPLLTEPSSENHFNEQILSEITVPTIGVVVRQLVLTVSYYHKEKVSLDLLTRKLNLVNTMSTNDLNEVLEMGTDQMPVLVGRALATLKLKAKLNLKNRQLEYSHFLIENCLYLIWSHLYYYMLLAIPKSKFSDTSKPVLWNPIAEERWELCQEDIVNVKQGLVSIFNDCFSQMLIDTKQDQSASEKGFVEAFLRRIKRLIQFVPVK